MFREKFTNFKQSRGYLYIRESEYVRDKRTLKRKPSKLGDGTATKDRGKYSKKKDIYCGKILEIDIKFVETFKDYIEKQDKDYFEYKLNLKYEELIDEFTNYLLYIYDIDKDNFFNGKKAVYVVGNGYLSRETINWLKRFNIKGNYESSKEIGRFTYRCEDVGIFDEDTINSLYLKLVPQVNKEDMLEEINSIQKSNTVEEYKSYRDFMKKS
ncbi:MAG: hypothetical protein PF569_05710 [Candidatus Woesearchaeota archaeon]|jgi:hypothetical protein|nr:hypothetical protein [Candidatus Woesearchaeota archaeon]